VAHNAGDREQLLVLAQRLIAALEQPIDLSGGEVKLGVSIGIASYPGNGNSIEDLLAAADAAMYEAKHRGKNRACFSENPISGRQTNG
jgi:diguanylate cyclase (GGDEF)-like protein